MISRTKAILLGLFFVVCLGITIPQTHVSGVQSRNNTYYVQARGSDDNNGLSKETSFQTLAEAVDATKMDESNASR